MRRQKRPRRFFAQPPNGSEELPVPGGEALEEEEGKQAEHGAEDK